MQHVSTEQKRRVYAKDAHCQSYNPTDRIMLSVSVSLEVIYFTCTFKLHILRTSGDTWQYLSLLVFIPWSNDLCIQLSRESKLFAEYLNHIIRVQKPRSSSLRSSANSEQSVPFPPHVCVTSLRYNLVYWITNHVLQICKSLSSKMFL